MEINGGRFAAVDSALDRVLDRVLDPVLGRVAARSPVGWSGPRSWWGGPLDVEGLASSSVLLLLRAVGALAEERGRPVALATSADRVAATFGSLAHLRVDGRAAPAWAPMSGWFETADGWIRLHANYPHHAAALSRTLGVRDRHELERVLRHLHSHVTEARVRAGGGIAGAMRTADEWRSTPMAGALDGLPWITFRGKGTRQPLAPTTDAPLAGTRVLDLTRVLAGPTCTQLLSLFGANVLRLDPPDRPELLESYLDTGAGKRSAVADLRRTDDLHRVHQLLNEADVLVTGYRPDALAAFGLDDDTVRARHPHVIHVSLSAWGADGPWARQRGFDSIVQAVSGIGHLHGSTDETGRFTPGALPVQALDLATGFGMAAAVVALLAARTERGAGSAHLSLARTAQLLLDAGPGRDGQVDGEQHDLEVDTTTVPSPHGTLTRVAAPALVDGVSLLLPAPGGYGSARLTWL